MKKLFFILIFCSCLVETAFAYDCSDFPVNPEIEFYSSYGSLNYDLSKTNSEITAIASQYGIMEKGLFASGLATVDVEWEISADTVGRFVSNYNICVVPERIKVYIGFSDPVIYVSKEIRKDKCKTELVIRHEQTHQQINKTALDYFLPLFQHAFYKIVKDVKPVHVANISEVDKASAELTREYNVRLSPLIDFFKKEMLKEQHKLDNADNYQYEQQLCR